MHTGKMIVRWSWLLRMTNRRRYYYHYASFSVWLCVWQASVVVSHCVNSFVGLSLLCAPNVMRDLVLKIVMSLMLTAVAEATRWQRHCDDNLPGGGRFAVHTQVHSLPVPTRVHHSPSTPDHFRLHWVQVRVCSLLTGVPLSTGVWFLTYALR